MALSAEVRRLERAWQNEAAWPKRLDWIEVEGVRGWTGQRIRFPFPIVAVAGTNGSGKSTILQACASIYQATKAKGSVRNADTKYATDFFPNTYWDKIENASIRFGYTEGQSNKEGSIRKPTERWKGYAERPIRPVIFTDLSRIVPVSGRSGYAKIAKSKHSEASFDLFDSSRLNRLSQILGNPYSSAKMSKADVDPHRTIPVLSRATSSYSGYHQGQGETTIAELIQKDMPKYALVLIDEIESSLHPSAQRRLIRDLAAVCRERELQIIITTHSPYVLEELPRDARVQIYEENGTRQAMIGVSAEFAMTKMDEVHHPDGEIYVEDDTARTLLIEILSKKNRDLASRIKVITCGAASVGYQLGIMVSQRRFPRATGVILDGDCKPATGITLLPGGDAPERVVFEGLKALDYVGLELKLGRPYPEVVDACDRAMLTPHHHHWVSEVSKKLTIAPQFLWTAMASMWSHDCCTDPEATLIENYIEDRLSEFAN